MQKLIGRITNTCCTHKSRAGHRIRELLSAFSDRRFERFGCVAGAILVSLLASPNLSAQATEPEAETPSFLEATPAGPRSRHSRVEGAASISPELAAEAYQANRSAMNLGYGRHGQEVALAYPKWKRANAVPYPSFSHGRRFLNNYVNDLAGEYLRFESAGVLPEGSIIAKNSFSISKNGKFVAGPLFLMEKMQRGFNYLSGDWRYTLISADGVVIGETKGRDATSVKFCITCHLAREKSDHLFFLPKQYR